MRVSEVTFNNNSPRPRLLIVNSIWSWIMVPQVPSKWKGAPGVKMTLPDVSWCQKRRTSVYHLLGFKRNPFGMCLDAQFLRRISRFVLEGWDGVMVSVVIFERKQTMIWGMVVRKLQVFCFGLVFLYCAKIHAKFDGFQVVIEDTVF